MGAAGADVKSIFGQAIAVASPAERAAYLQEACGSDPKLRAEVEALLYAYRDAGSFLGERSPSPAATVDERALQGPGTVIGPYTLREQIDEGGMGLVFVAEQQHPIPRKVALKVIKPGMDTRQVVARFEVERQALALMDHPHIARVLDGGETTGGQPYFVMELVRGVPITQFCDENRLTTRARLELFMSVCLAVRHAHQKGIIHRDLKPSNVLVTALDDAPVAKVIDFGVAKAIGQSLTDKTVHTQFAQMVGTPLYMSPEQAGRSGMDVDTRSDIYALGVLMYELLTGTTPFDKERMREAGYDELRRMIREEVPPKPSTRINTLGEAATTVSAQRQSDPRRLSEHYRGGLDWIVMKCLEKDRDRRYETANGVAVDIQRYLADEPVQARPPSAGYRLRKWARRHRAVLTAFGMTLAFALLALLAGGVAFVLNLREEQKNTLAEKGRVEEEKGRVERERDRVREEKKNVRRLLYDSTIPLAFREWQNAQIGTTQELLGGPNCPADLRGWEWHYLRGLCHKDLATYRADAGEVNGVAFSPNGRLLALTGENGTVQVWDVVESKRLRAFAAHKGIARGVAFSRDGKHLASVGEDGALKVWSTATWAESPALAGAREACPSVAFHPDGRLIAAAAGLGIVKVWDRENGAEIASLRHFVVVPAAGPRPIRVSRGVVVWGLAFSPDGKHLATVGGETVQLWDTTGWQNARTFSADGAEHLMCLAFAPGGQVLAAGGADNVIRLWSVSDGKLLRTLAGHTDSVRGLAFSRDGKHLASASDDRTAQVWDAASGRRIATHRGHLGPLHAVAFHPDGRLATVSRDGTARLWEPLSRPESRRLPGTRAAAFHPDGRHVMVNDSTLKLLDMATGREAAAFPGNKETVFRMAFRPDGRQLARIVQGGKMLKLWDLSAGREGPVLEGHAVSFSPDGRRMATASRDGIVRLRDSTTGREEAALPGHSALVHAVSFSPDGAVLASAGHDGTVRLWDIAAEREIVTLRGHNGIVNDVAFHPNGRVLASAGADRTVRLWDTASGAELRTMRGHTDRVLSVAFSPAGDRLATGGWEGTVRVWDTNSGVQLLALDRPNAVVFGLEFSRDGRRLLACGDELTLWEAPAEDGGNDPVP